MSKKRRSKTISEKKWIQRQTNAWRLIEAWGDGLDGHKCLIQRDSKEARRELHLDQIRIENWIAAHPNSTLARSGIRPEFHVCPGNPEVLCVRLRERAPFPGEATPRHWQPMEQVLLTKERTCHLFSIKEYFAKLEAVLQRKKPKPDEPPDKGPPSIP